MGYTKKDAAQDTETTPSQATGAWHAARNDAAASGELPERNAEKVSDSEDGGFLNFLARLAGFGRSGD